MAAIVRNEHVIRRRVRELAAIPRDALSDCEMCEKARDAGEVCWKATYR